MSRLPALYLIAVLVVMLGAFAGQAFVPRWIGRHTAWGFAPGWQREIALWNVGMVIVIANAIWSADPADIRAVATAMVILNSLLGTNHLVAVRLHRAARLHWMGAAVNYIGVAIGVAALWR